MSLLTMRESVADVKVLDMSFWAWVKAGVAFSLGAGIVSMLTSILWWAFVANLAAGVVRALGH